jgi:hypothetical protein
MKRIRVFTTDIVDPRHRTADTVITPSMRILPESAPPAPDLGARLDGSSGRPVDVDQLGADLTAAFDDLLSPADLRKLKAILAKYSGNSGNTSRVGITSTDSTDAVDEARAAVAHVRGNCDRLASINDRNRAFWEKRTEAETARILGR